MVTVRKRRIGNSDFYYMEHAVRNKGKVEKREQYLGKELPKNIEELKKEFLSQIYQERFYPIIEKIKKNVDKELKITPPSAVKEETEKFTTHFTYDTQKIEGSSLTLRETADLLERNIAPKSKPMRDVKEAEAHKSIFEDMLQTEDDITLSLVLHWHKRLFQETKPDIGGMIRKHQVIISGSKFIPPIPSEVYPLLQDFFKWYNQNKKKTHPVILAALVHLKFVTIHPFADGNGRISRLIMNLVLKRNGYPLFNIHYEGRMAYYTALERAQTKKMDMIFAHWLLKRYIKEYVKYSK